MESTEINQVIPDEAVNVPEPDQVFSMADLAAASATRSIKDNAYITILETGNNNEVMAEINFRPPGYSRLNYVIIRTKYGSKVEDWTVNIGDSKTNGGWGGDATTQSNDAECQILDGNYTLYANDYGGAGVLASLDNFVSPYDTVDFKVQNGFAYAYNRTKKLYVSKSSRYLYALAGQADAEGPVNYKIYAAINRVISGRSRNGKYVSDITISLYYVC